MTCILEEGECFCNLCKGKGRVLCKDNIYATCMDCKGTGKIDWVEKITGKSIREKELIVNVFNKINEFVSQANTNQTKLSVPEFLESLKNQCYIHSFILHDALIVNNILKYHISFQPYFRGPFVEHTIYIECENYL